MTRRIAIVGTINHDRIVTPAGETYEDLGGILYNVLAMAPFLGADDSLLPVARVGAERRAEVETLLSPYPCIDPSRLLWWPGGTNETVLRYLSADVREESLVERIVPLREEEVQGAADSRIVIANLIWGKELDPTLLHVLASRGARVLLDIQSLTLTFRRGPGRAYRNIPAWREWAAPVEVLKGNEEEIRWFAGEDGPHRGAILGAMRKLLGAGPSVVVATKGTAGSTVAWREGDRTRAAEVRPLDVPPEECVDATGCGDAYTSGFALALLDDEGPPQAALLGSTLAGLVCRTRGLRALAGLPDPWKIRKELYRPEIERMARGRFGTEID